MTGQGHATCGCNILFMRIGMEKRMMDIRELGAYIGLKPQTIRNQISLGRFMIPTKKIGRLLKWDRRDVDQFLDRLRKIN